MYADTNIVLVLLPYSKGRSSDFPERRQQPSPVGKSAQL
jgi:hypothetical protein